MPRGTANAALAKNKPSGPVESPAAFFRHIAVIFDNQVLSAPRLIQPIRSNGEISGNFTREEVEFIVSILRAGSLPVQLRPDPVSERIVEPR